jgi:hypothetical protein
MGDAPLFSKWNGHVVNVYNYSISKVLFKAMDLIVISQQEAASSRRNGVKMRRREEELSVPKLQFLPLETSSRGGRNRTKVPPTFGSDEVRSILFDGAWYLIDDV